MRGALPRRRSSICRKAAICDQVRASLCIMLGIDRGGRVITAGRRADQWRQP